MNLRNKAFTLIEMLIVVAIIAILAVIAMPNFLEAQTRSKASCARADMRAITSALEIYCVDYKRYPPARSFCSGAMDSVGDYYMCPMEITTPVAYVSNRTRDVFNPLFHYKYATPGFGYTNYGVHTILGIWVPRNFPHDTGLSDDVIYFDMGASPVKWALWSVGPKGDIGFWDSGVAHHPVPRRNWYDPTNGTVSPGVITRLSTGHLSP